MYHIDKYFLISNIHGKNRNPWPFLYVFNVSVITRSGRHTVSAAGGQSPHQLVFKQLVGNGSLAGSYITFRERATGKHLSSSHKRIKLKANLI